MNKGILGVLAVKSFLYIWLAEIFSQIAMNMLNFVLIIAVYNLTSSNSAVAGIVLTFTAPAIFFGVLAGVIVDRFDKKYVLFYANLIRAALLILISFFDTNLVFIYLFAFVFFVVTQFFIPAETPIIPLVVPKKLLLPANALFGMGIYASILIAYALSSPFLIILGEKNTYYTLMLFFVIAALLILLVKPRKKNALKVIKLDTFNREFIVKQMKQTAELIIKTRDILHALLLLTFFNVLILIIAAIGPGYARQIVNISVESFPILLVTPAALGMVIGAVLVGHFFEKYPRDKTATIGIFLIGIAAILLPFGSKVSSKPFIIWLNGFLPHLLVFNILHFMILLAFILGVGGAFIFVPSNTILQEKTSDEIRGKIYGFSGAITGIFSLLPVIIIGRLADILGVDKVLTLLGSVILIIAIFRSKSLFLKT